mmetsp:Transcript_48454/g.113399  ORF Transcript_48454/g.113399 Transcript_48454/m.113399 type:complete len:102 (-) Transcript_48454:233-538(-)
MGKRGHSNKHFHLASASRKASARDTSKGLELNRHRTRVQESVQACRLAEVEVAKSCIEKTQTANRAILGVTACLLAPPAAMAAATATTLSLGVVACVCFVK